MICDYCGRPGHDAYACPDALAIEQQRWQLEALEQQRQMMAAAEDDEVDIEQLKAERDAAIAAQAQAEAAVVILRRVAEYFVNGYWRRVHIGNPLMQQIITVEDQTLADLRQSLHSTATVAAALMERLKVVEAAADAAADTPDGEGA